MVSVNGNQIMIGARQFCDSLEGITLECRLETVVSERIWCESIFRDGNP